MADPPPFRLALPPNLVFEDTAAPQPSVPPTGRNHDAPIDRPSDRRDDDITTTLRSPELFGIELDDPVVVAEKTRSPSEPAGQITGGSDVGDESDDPGEDGATTTGRRVRPYTITGGRTAVAGPEIPLEAQVLTSTHRPADPQNYRWETARLVEMVEVPMALVEVAARLEVPVGVARVLVSDLVTEGVLIVHLPPPASSFTSLLEQVLDGVRRL